MSPHRPRIRAETALGHMEEIGNSNRHMLLWFCRRPKSKCPLRTCLPAPSTRYNHGSSSHHIKNMNGKWETLLAREPRQPPKSWSCCFIGDVGLHEEICDEERLFFALTTKRLPSFMRSILKVYESFSEGKVVVCV